MRGNEIELCLSEMRRWTSLAARGDVMKITALERGVLSMNTEMRKSLSEKLGDNSWNLEFYATEDMKILALQPERQSSFKFPKNGRRQFKSYVEGLVSKGYKIPATYHVEWNERLQSWVGVLQEVAESPRVTRRRKTNVQ